MSDLTDHYRVLLGLDASWRVERVDFSLEEKKVEIGLIHAGGGLCCPDCGVTCSQADLAPEREWRHLDTMQFQTVIRARLPRAKCPQCGVKTIRIPWADKHSRFTLLFEAFAIEVLQACSNVKRAAALLGLDWQTTHGIMQRAVERGLRRRDVEEVCHVGLDEKSFGQGQSYVSVLTDLDGGRVLEVTEDRTEEAADALWNSLPPSQREKVRGVAMDMWQPYLASTRRQAPQAEIVHDKFHVSKHLNEAVDQVRRRENKALRAEGDDRLVGSKQLWLFHPKNLSKKRKKELAALKEETLKTSRAWAIKEHFRKFWNYTYASSAGDFFADWYGWAVRSRLPPIIAKAKMLKRHLNELLSYFRQQITNAMSEGYNSKIQFIKSSARGFRAFENYRTRILFYCGKLQLTPDGISH
jgi:transposase